MVVDARQFDAMVPPIPQRARPPILDGLETA
jgi:hypothetical protein